MDLRQALDTFGVAQGVPVIMSRSVDGTFSGAFKDVPASEFLLRLCMMHNLTWYYDGAAIYVYAAGEMQTTLQDLKYMKAQEVRDLLRELGVEDSRFPIKTAANDELIMVSGPPRYVQLVMEMIARADKLREMRTFNEVETRIFPLVHTWADTVSFSVTSPESSVPIKGVALILEEMMNATAGGQVREGTNSAPGEVLKEAMGAQFRPLIKPENRLNAVIVRDVATRMPMYEKVIRDLDKPQKLVEIVVTTVEMTREDALDWQLSLKVQGARDKFEGGAGQNAQNLFNSADLAGAGLAGAFSYLGKDVTVAASLSAMKSKGRARNISRTSILTANNMAASINDTQSYHARVVGQEVASLETVSAGMKLEVKPRLVPPPPGVTNQPTQVWLTMSLEDGGFGTVSVDNMPMTRSSRVQTQAALPEKESLMLAGYFRDIDETGGWGIPYLRDIPWIGWIFGGYSRMKETVQRFFIITPYLVDVSYQNMSTQTVVSVQTQRLRNLDVEDRLDDESRDDEEAQDDRDEERKARQEEMHEKRLEQRAIRREAREEAAKKAKRERAAAREQELEAARAAEAEKRAQLAAEETAKKVKELAEAAAAEKAKREAEEAARAAAAEKAKRETEMQTAPAPADDPDAAERARLGLEAAVERGRLEVMAGEMEAMRLKAEAEKLAAEGGGNR